MFAQHRTAPYKDIICLKEAKIMFAQHCTAPLQILYGLIRFAQHCTAPYNDILCLGEVKKTFAQHCTAPYKDIICLKEAHTDIIWFNNVCPTLHSSL